MRLLLGFLILSMLLAGCSAIDDLDDVARTIAKLPIDDVDDAAIILAKYSGKLVSTTANSGDDAGRLVINNPALKTYAKNNLDDALSLVAKSKTRNLTTDELFDLARARNVKLTITRVESANRVKISQKLEDALNAMVKDTACLYLEKAFEEGRLPTAEEYGETFIESGAGELFKYADFEAEFIFSVTSELYNLQSLKADTPADRLQSYLFKDKYCGW